MNFHILGVVFSIASTLLRGGKTILQKRLLSSEDQAIGKEGSQVVPQISSVALLNLMAPQVTPSGALARCSASSKCLAILFVASCSMEGLEPWDRMLFSENSEVTLHLWILFNCLNACLLNLSNFITASFVSPLTLQLLGNVKTVLGIFISALIFGNAVTPAQAAGCGAAVGGVYVYQRFGRSYERTSNHSVTKTASADSMETSTPHITTDGLRPV
ncbi:hypothetical protein Pmar_PMAR002699 [Perkinsus marinus ATCC 50983]|uniref:Sugar phosphate transporter domain-containing protein n=1 Tax=Perkinsus marinus (strain ATCC 50983 / TXsc) TaxID=423536 RepID=C5L4J3_PERM5|nr:hypothetical protein Pmar_PMAR002699 [Perkinsus marinus ATCC 50983]EER08324.1 hypothetical protein Pmar_PMAR002699 [Perkinsus marinus ATCC 50983]|eukprot:XP_002776508.1 hypothetical protein Pmar_PMAR002699 [Perkinsus marinus ATCC 50983]